MNTGLRTQGLGTQGPETQTSIPESWLLRAVLHLAIVREMQLQAFCVRV